VRRNLSYSPEQHRPLQAVCAFTIARPRAAVTIVRNARTHDPPYSDKDYFFVFAAAAAAAASNWDFCGLKSSQRVNGSGKPVSCNPTAA